MSHDYSPTNNSSKRSPDEPNPPASFASNMVTERTGIFNAANTPINRPVHAPPTTQQAENNPDGTIKTVKSLSDSYAGGEFNNRVSSFADPSDSASRQSTLDLQMRNEIITTYRQTTQINTQTDEVRSYTGKPIPLEESPHIDYADQIEPAMHMVQTGNLPSVNHAIITKNPMIEPEWKTKVGQPMSGNVGVSEPAQHWSAASTLTRDHQKSLTEDNEPLPEPPCHKAPPAPFRSSVKKPGGLPYAAHSFESQERRMLTEDDRCTKFVKFCKKMGCYVNHEMTIASAIFIVESICLLTFFFALHSSWFIWYIVPIIEIALLVTIGLSIYAFRAEKYTWHYAYIIVHSVASILILVLTVFYLFAHESCVFQTVPYQYAHSFVDNFPCKGYINFSASSISNIPLFAWVISMVLLGCAVADILICALLAHKIIDHPKRVKKISTDKKHITQISNAQTQSVYVHTGPEIPVDTTQV